jgi:hypothetical protein
MAVSHTYITTKDVYGIPRTIETTTETPDTPHQNVFATTPQELQDISNRGGGTLQTIGSTYEVKPSQEFIRSEAKTEIEKTAGEPVRKVEDIRSPSGTLTAQYFKGESGKLYLYDYSKQNLLTYGSAERIAIPTASGLPITLSTGVTQKVGGAEGLKQIMMQRDIKILGENYSNYIGRVSRVTAETVGNVAINSIQTAILSGITGAVWISNVPKLTIGLSTAYLGYSTYGLTKESIEGTLTPMKTALYLASIGLSSASIYSGFLQMKPPDMKKLEFGALSKEEMDIKGNIKKMEGYVTSKSPIGLYENVLTREEISKMFEHGKTISETQNIIIKDWEGYKGYFFKNPTGFPENQDDLINIIGKQISYVGKFSGMDVIVGEKIGFPVSFNQPKGSFKITIASPPDNFVGIPLSKTFPMEISETRTVVTITQTINNPLSLSIPALNIIPKDISIEKSISTVTFKTQEKQTSEIRTITQLSLEQQFKELANIKNPMLKDYTTNIFKTTPVEIQTPKFSTDQEISLKIAQIPALKLETVNLNRTIEQIKINTITQLPPTESIFNLRESTGERKSFKIIVKSPFGKPNIFKVSSRILPTASLVSLEKSFARYGSGSLARGSGIEKVFRNLSRQSGLATEFPAMEEIRGYRSKGRKRK